MWNFFKRWFARKDAPQDVAAALSDVARAKALAEARFLYSRGAWARNLEPGEVPKEEPEIGREPLPD